MRSVRRSTTVAADPGAVWKVVGDAHHLPRWWPRVERVEAVGKGAFTQVLRSDRGRAVRADFRVTEHRQPHARTWEQQVDGTPFERFLSGAVTRIELTPREGGTEVTLSLSMKLRGMARFGGYLARRAARKQADEALAALKRLL
jgi:uncharacterized protein YndB with AHSA1/START domain